jgi:N-acyl-D-amino-acid deacylase
MGTLELQNARIVDGSGGEVFEASICIADGRIRRISSEAGGADREIDVDGSYLAPGFVDMHAHSELRLFSHPGAAEKLTQGITLEVGGQDGVSVAPVSGEDKQEWKRRIQTLLGSYDDWSWNTIDEFLKEIEAADPAVNFAYYAPHGNLRSSVVGFQDRPLDDQEIAKMQDRLSTALDSGAFAMSKGMIYPPSSYGQDREFVKLAQILGAYDTFMVSHVWNETDRVVESIERYIDICEQGGCDPHVSHLKVAGESNWGRSEEIIETFDTAVDRGTAVTFDQYPYTAGSTMLTALLPPWVRTGETDEILNRLQETAIREKIADDIRSADGDWENLARAAGTWKNILITHTGSGNREGETIADIASDRNLDPIHAMCDLLVSENLDVTMADFVMDEVDIERFIKDTRGTVCSDGIFGGKPHPRAIGTGARVLERYVHNRDALSINEAIYKLAGHPADILGLPDRGRVEEGYIADLVVFDLGQVEERATYHDPLNLSRGMKYVLVDGEIAVENGIPTGARPGSVLRSVEEWEDKRRPRVRSRIEN